MPVGAQTLAVNPGLGNGIGRLLGRESEHLGDDCGAGDLDKDDVVKANLVVRVQESQAALNLVCLDHGLEDITDGELLAAGNGLDVGARGGGSLVGTGDPVGDGKDGAQVVRRVTPFSSQPAVVVIQPADHGTDVEGAVDRVQLVGGTGDLGAIGNRSALNNRAQQLGALLKAETLKTAADGVEENPSCRVKLTMRLSVG